MEALLDQQCRCMITRPQHDTLHRNHLRKEAVWPFDHRRFHIRISIPKTTPQLLLHMRHPVLWSLSLIHNIVISFCHFRFECLLYGQSPIAQDIRIGRQVCYGWFVAGNKIEKVFLAMFIIILMDIPDQNLGALLEIHHFFFGIILDNVGDFT